MQLVCASCGAKNRVPEARVHDGPLCGKCGAPLADGKPFALTDRTFDEYIGGTQQPVVADFWADWCAPCRAMAPQFAAAAAELPDVRFAKVDTEASPRASVRHRIRSIPTMVLFQGGREVARRSGAMPAKEIASWIRQQLRAAA